MRQITFVQGIVLYYLEDHMLTEFIFETGKFRHSNYRAEVEISEEGFTLEEREEERWDKVRTSAISQISDIARNSKSRYMYVLKLNILHKVL